jgi:uncharacterized protein YbjT (DUF2867 family)
MKVLIAGASGFIGRALIEKLLTREDVEIVALSRTPRVSPHPRLVWKRCDLFSMKDIQESMSGCTEAYYLVHSMLPSADLSQGSFYDSDLILADNFVRCAKGAGVRHIIYLGGMIPDGGKLSWHLRSRLEVEECLRLSGIPVTTLRAGLIIGKNGSSFEILHRLVERLPLMVCPAWTNTESQPIALEEILSVLEQCLLDPSVQGRIYDVGGPEVLTYQALILKTARALGLRRRLYSFNLIPLKFSGIWVRLITGVSKDLVYPLVLSLLHRMVAHPSQAWTRWVGPRVPVDQALERALSRGRETPQDLGKRLPAPKRGHEVRSVQRLVHPVGVNAEWVANEYFAWLPSFFATLLKVTVEGRLCTFSLLFRGLKLLILEKSLERSSPDRQLLYIRGGILASKKMVRGRLEFREALGGRVILAAIHEYIPALPWVVYRFTQAIVHLWVMRRFDRHLGDLMENSLQNGPKNQR